MESIEQQQGSVIVLSKELAEIEVQKWLNLRQVRNSVRIKCKQHIETLVDAMCDGILSLEDNGLKQQLQFPIENKDNEVVLSELLHKNRFKVKQLSEQVEGVSVENFVEFNLSYIAAITDTPRVFVSNMEHDDFKIAQAVASFFM